MSIGIDWCEPNYVHSKYIAETFNTITSISYIIAAYVVWRRIYYLPKEGGWLIWTTIGMITMVGVTSMYYHATLSLLGQFMDETYIIIMYFVGCIAFTPNKMLSLTVRGKEKISVGLFVALPLITPLVFPVWRRIHNHSPFYMLFLGLIVNVFLLVRGLMYKNSIHDISILNKLERIDKKIRIANLITLIAFGFWILDWSCSAYWHRYTHGVWHILTAISVTIAGLQGVEVKKIELIV